MRLTILGAGPAYSDREGSSGASYLVSEGDTHILLDLGHGSFSRIFPHVHPDGARGRDREPPSRGPLHRSRARCGTTCATSSSPRAACGCSGPPHWRIASTRCTGSRGSPLRPSTRRSSAKSPGAIGALSVRARRVAHTDDSYAVRVARQGAGPASSTAVTAVGRRMSPRWSSPATRCWPRCPSGPDRSRVDAMHLDGPAVGRLAFATGAGRVLLTHLQMGYDPDATLASVLAQFHGPVSFVWPGNRVDI